jgi:hypothetical protein
MTNAENFQTLDLSRRRLLRGAVFAVAGGALVGGVMTSSAVGAPHKLPQQAVAYQPTPKGKLRCDNCNQWQAPNACKTVTGVIDPAGWCTLYKPNS